jgi:hypothetical protein
MVPPVAASPARGHAELGRLVRRSGLRRQALSSALAPSRGAETRGSRPTCVGLDWSRKGPVSRPCGLQGPLADRRGRIRGGRSTRARA